MSTGTALIGLKQPRAIDISLPRLGITVRRSADIDHNVNEGDGSTGKVDVLNISGVPVMSA